MSWITESLTDQAEGIDAPYAEPFPDEFYAEDVQYAGYVADAEFEERMIMADRFADMYSDDDVAGDDYAENGQMGYDYAEAELAQWD
jgi:hypothetical protein